MDGRVRVLLLLALVLGLSAAAASLTVPVVAAVGNDPILRLVTLDPSIREPAVTVDRVNCGSTGEGLRPSDERVSIERLARDRACRNESQRRVAAAIASGVLVAVTGLMGLVASAGRGLGP